jgi:PAS domain S-box-containing protein
LDASAPAISGSIDPLSPGRAERDRRRLTRRVLGGAIIVALAIVGLTTMMLWRLQQAQLEEGLGNISALDLLVAAQTERAFESVGVVLDDVSADLQAQGIASADALRQAAGDEAMFRLLRAKMAGIPQFESLAITSSAGDVINRTRSYPITIPTNVANREYFARLRDHPEIKAYISPPLLGADGKPLIYIGKRLNAPNGAFIGIVLGALHADYFQELYANYLGALPGGGKSMALWRSDGTLVARSPLEPDAADATPPDLARPPSSNGFVSYWASGPRGSTIAIAQRRFDELPLSIEVRQSASAMLAPWNGEFLATGIGGGALLLLVGAAVWLLMRQLRTEALIIEERSRANRETETREDVERARMKAEAAMREMQQSEARFRDIAEVGSDWIWETDAEHRFTLIAGARQPRVNLIGKTRWDQAGVDPAADPLWREHIAVLDAHQPFRQFRFARGPVHLCVSGKPIFADDGSFVGYRGTVSDESELVEARERAMRADALLRNAIESIAEGFVIFDAEDRFVMCNEAYRKMYGENAAGFVPGATYEEIMRQALATGRHPGAIGREEEWLAERLRKHREATDAEESRLADGRWVMRSERHMADGGIAGLRIDITALKQAQEALRESQVMLNRAQKLSGTGSVVRNLQTKTTEWSDEMYRIFGVERGLFAVGTHNFLAMVHPDDRARVEELVTRSSVEADPPAEFRIIRPDGTMRWVYREADIWHSADGTPAIRLTTYKDITEQREADMRQRELEALLRDAIESISEGFVIYDAEDCLVLCNEAYRKLYPEAAELMVPGTRFEDVLRSALKEGRYTDAIGREEEWLAERMRARREFNGPFEAQWADGRWMLISERRTSSGGVAGLRVDITALKRVQQSLRDSQQRLDRTQKIAHIGTVERDLRNGTVVWSEETFRIFGVDPATYTPSAENLLGFIHPDDRSLVLDVLRRSNHLEEANKSAKFRIVRPGGEPRSILAQAHVASDDAGKPLYVSIAMMDITDKELASLRQLELETQLRHSEKLTALGTLAGGIAHDLNNTLVPIQALSKLVMQELPAEARPRGDLEIIYQASIQARDLVRQILAFSRKQEIINEPTDIAARLRESLHMLRASVPSTIEIIDRIAPVQTILADGTQLQQVVVNLVTNSAFAIGDKCGRVTVTLDEVPGEPGAPHLVRLSVADTGCGMSPDIVRRLFEPFFTTKSVGEGTGLGLSVVHGIVTSHGGTIDVKSAPGKGTEFIILLPAKPVDERGIIAAVA